ncbi:MAG: hypothetical protein DRR16_00060 [Candidatus Parabeggiatoa sp. nov. 3]|nr:MAG: hypothetical protein DRR00_05820 [Gammaproteobacteria bacterium]RKZ69611.1 MAG: hypothetical protein DRQ99_00480 [Gammaproteobacteria bacterium]RKZ90266.1 MAG: hypothetical protein DRR16_00060 [Gammaproteobacteria bacterium]
MFNSKVEIDNGSTGSSHLPILLLCLMILIYREPDGFFNPQFWAEDGSLFFKQNLTLSISAIWQPYVGYLLIIPRLVAYFSGFFPVSWVPALYNLGFIILTLFVINYLLSSRIHLPFKPFLAITIVFLPYNGEILMSLTNVQWILAIVLILFIIQDKPNTTRQLLLDTATIIAIGLTGPFIVLFLPLFLFRIIYICRSYYSLHLLSVAFLLSLIQGYFIWQASKPVSSGELAHSLEALEQVLAMRFSGTLFFGDYISLALNSHLLAGMTIILFAGLLTFAILETRQKRLPIFVFLLGGCIITLACFYKFRYNLHVLVPFNNGYRYFYIPHLLIVWSLIVCFDSKGISKFISALLLLMVSVSLSSFSHFQVAPLTDYHWEKYSKQIEREKDIKIPINPDGWFLKIKNSPQK